MDNTIITALHSSFENISKNKDGVTYWLAREIQPLLEYARWENFETAIERAKTACDNAEQDVDNHFREVTKMVDIGSDTTRKVIPIEIAWNKCRTLKASFEINDNVCEKMLTRKVFDNILMI